LKKILGIGSIESVFDEDHDFKKYSSTFVNNLITYKSDHKDEDVHIIDCRDHVKADNPIESMMSAVLSHGVIDGLIISSHSDWFGLYIFSKTRKELSEDRRYLLPEFDWRRFKFSPNAYVRLWGCQTAGRNGVLIKDSIAQIISDETQRLVYAFTSRSSQRKVGKRFVQIPDNKKTVILKPRVIST